MTRVPILIEKIRASQSEAFGLHTAGISSFGEAERQSESVASDLGGYGLDVIADFAPVPFFEERFSELQSFSTSETNPDLEASSIVIAATIETSNLDNLISRQDIIVWANSEMTLFGEPDCNPYKPAASIQEIQKLLEVESIWNDGFKGKGIAVGIIDEGVNGDWYNVTQGIKHPYIRPGQALIHSHGSMCAADVLVSAPEATIYDYPVLSDRSRRLSYKVIDAFQQVLDQRREDGTPHLTNNSYGFMVVPPKNTIFSINHEIWEIQHPLHRKVREVIASGCPAFFSAGNCGEPCPDNRCHSSSIGSGKSIHASNSLQEVITVAAVNHLKQRIGYSSQGDGMFEKMKPDIACYSHFFANYGPGRPSQAHPFDSGTSAATPVAAGVAALLLNAFPKLVSERNLSRLKEALIKTANNINSQGWNQDTGHGIISAKAAYDHLKALGV